MTACSIPERRCKHVTEPLTIYNVIISFINLTSTARQGKLIGNGNVTDGNGNVTVASMPHNGDVMVVPPNCNYALLIVILELGGWGIRLILGSV